MVRNTGSCHFDRATATDDAEDIATETRETTYVVMCGAGPMYRATTRPRSDLGEAVVGWVEPR